MKKAILILALIALSACGSKRAPKYITYRLDEFQLIAVDEYVKVISMPIPITDHAWLLYEGPYYREAMRVAQMEWKKHPSYSLSVCQE